MLCLTLTGETLEENALIAAACPAEIYELRTDLLKKPDADQIIQFSRQMNRPMILTCRRERDGGAYRRTDRTRASFLKKLLQEGAFSYADLEEDFKRSELEQIAAERGIEIIRSFHDLEKVPVDLFARIERISQRGEIPKAAVTACGIRDVVTLFNAEAQLRHIPKKIVLAMGPWGVPTRILYRRTGSFLTFASAPNAASAAPGHLDYSVMKDLYRCESVNSDTKIYGIIGNPVLHSASPRIHNPAYRTLGLNAVYVPFQVDDVRTFFMLADSLGIQGFSVTIPHKQEVLPYLGRITREVKQIGSCNTVVWERDTWKGINTDYYGFLRPIFDDLEQDRIKHALVIGAGGAARSAVWALRNHQCSVTVLNRTVEKAQQLALQTGSTWGSLDEADRTAAPDLIVQTTNVGMEPDTDADPLPAYQFRGQEILYELIYAPETTPIIERARRAGCRIVTGKQMLFSQGILQFETFTGLSYPFSEAAAVF